MLRDSCRIDKGRCGDVNGETADYSAVIALLRFQACLQIMLPWHSLVAAFRRVSAPISMKRSPATRKLSNCETRRWNRWRESLTNVAFRQSCLDNLDSAITDYTALIERQNAPLTRAAEALVNRGISKRKRSNSNGAIADCTAVIALRDVLGVKELSRALHGRRLARRAQNDREGAIADFVAAIELPNAPAAYVAAARMELSFPPGPDL
jgi:hypothetical protein